MKGLTKILLVAAILLVAVGAFGQGLLNIPTLADANAFYEKWKSTSDANKPGYVYEFKIPEKVYLDRAAMYKPGEEHLASAKYPCVTDPDLGFGSQDGAIVLMGANGEDGEFPKLAGTCVSTDEAMGYGMMIAVMADDQELFNKFARVVEYYKTFYSAYDQLTSWVIPAETAGYYPEYKNMKTVVDARIAEGWEYKIDAGDQSWATSPLDYWVAKKMPAYDGDGKIIGSKLIIKEGSNEGSSVSGIAMDGSLDIAFAYLMAHMRWYNGDASSLKQGDYYYLGMACDRYVQIIKAIDEYGKNKDGKRFLPKGTYNLIEKGANGITRPSDWLLTHLRAYYECVGSESARNMIGYIQDQMDDFDDDDAISSALKVPGQPSHTGFVPDFAEYKGSELEPVYTIYNSKGEQLIYENSPNTFHINAARYPFRQALDYLMYGDKYSLERAIDVIKLPYAKYKGNGAVDDYSKYGDPFDAGWKLDGTAFSEYTNKVLQASAMVTIFAANKAGITKYNDMFNAYMKDGLDDWIAFDRFDSQYSDWRDGPWERTKDGKTESDNFEFKTDPSGHTGYFEDTWTLMALYTMAGKWVRPHAYLNEFDDSGTKWSVSPDSDSYATLTESGGDITVTINGNPGTKAVNIQVEGFETKINSGYALMLSLERTNGSGPADIVGYLSYPDYSKTETVTMNNKITVDENGVTRGYMGYFDAIVKKVPSGIDGQQKGKIVFNLNAAGSGLQDTTVFKITQLGFYDPPENVGRYRYVGLWRTDEPFYLVGDYVSHNLDTWVCIKDHNTTRSSTPQQGSEYWELSDYNLVGEKWTANTYYEDGTLVHYQGRTYIARVSLHSVTPPPKAASAWMLYYDPHKGRATDWFSGADYLAGDLVYYNGNLYECKIPHASNAGWDPVAAFTLWTKVNYKFTYVNPLPWESWTYYEAGAIVMHDGTSYTCLNSHTSQPGWTPNAIAALWSKN